MNSTIAPQGCQTPRIREYLYLLTSVIAGETHTGDESVAKSPPFVGGDQVVGLDALGGGEHRAVQYSAASSAAASCTIRTALPRDRRRSAKKRSQMREPSSAAFILRRRSAYAASPSEARMRRARRARPTARLRR